MKTTHILRSCALTLLRSSILAFFLLFSGMLYGQLSTNEQPYSWAAGRSTLNMSSIPVANMPHLDLEALHKEDLENERLGGTPYRFGFTHEVNLSLTNSGVWENTSDGGRLWRLRIYSPDAVSLNLLYDKFWLPEGAKFFLYSEDMQQHIGAFTALNNKGDRDNIRGFATGFLFTNRIVLEYYEPPEVDEHGIISIYKIVSGYRYANRKDPDPPPLTIDCFRNINCPIGDDWQEEKDAVALMIMGGSACSGALLNTTANDHRPVFLSAEHCFHAAFGTPVEEWIFYWNFDAPCSDYFSTDMSLVPSTSGANLLAKNENTDFMLLDLSPEDPKWNNNITLYYLGWDRDTSNMILPPAVGIHHFGLNEQRYSKAISITGNKIGDVIYKDLQAHHEPEFSFLANTLWIVKFEEGAVYKGSSGSPLLNTNKRVVGQFWGSFQWAYCPPPLANPPLPIPRSYYGIFGVSWDGATSSERLKDWLDPLHTDAQFIDGISGCTNLVNKTITKDTTITGCRILHVRNVNIINGVSVDMTANESVVIDTGFYSVAGSNVHIWITASKLEVSPSSTSSEVSEINTSEGLETKSADIAYLKHSFSLHPNPNNGNFQLETNFPLSDIANLKITNLLGVPVYETQLLASTKIQLPNAGSGMFFVMINLKDGTVLTQKMIVQK